MNLYIRCLALLSFVPVLGCTAPDNRFDDFEEHVIDAAVVVRFDAPPVDVVPDVTGQFLFGMVAPIGPDLVFYFIGDVVLDSAGPTIDLSLRPLDLSTLTPIGDPFLGNGDVSSAGQYTADFKGIIPGAANPFSTSDLTLDGEMHGTIRNENLFCGDVTGNLTAPILLDLTGSTFAAIRITPGTTGMDLPPVLTKCPDPDGPVDAGAPDAPPPPPDAAGVDAGAPDAG